MPEVTGEELKIFYCYAREDEVFRKELEIHLSGMKRQYRLKHWHDRAINPGEDWAQTIDDNLKTADLILLLISPNFLASDYCYSTEMQQALERDKQGLCRVVPVLLRPVYWEDMPFRNIQLLPTDAKPITRWSDRDDAFHDVAKGIGQIVKTVLTQQKTAEYWFHKGKASYNLKRLDDALAAFECSILLDPSFALPWNGKGNVLRNLKRFDEALAAFERSILLDPSSAPSWNGKGNVFADLQRFDDALIAYEQAILLDPSFAHPWNGKGNVLSDLQRFDDALIAYEQAILLDPSFALAWYNKSILLEDLNSFKEAQEAQEKAYQLGYSPA